MSKIGEMFVKDIGRRMNPVIMAGDQSDEAIIFQELDEYVVTQEIDENLETFYKAFLDGIKNRTSNIGAWVSGDFGSGKSHFLKVLSYLLKNDTVVGKKSIDYFKEKVSPQVLTLMQAVEKKNIDTILFDIDSESKEGQNADNLVQIYLMVFNRMCGLSTVAAVANMERYLISENKYDRFKEEFEKTSGKTWESQRMKPTFIKPKIEVALLNSGAYNNSEDAKRVANEVTLKYDISSSEFAELVNEHCMKKGDDYVLVFLVDEVGQFISKKTQVMLKLQSITQDLGSTCRGKVWNIVTSQEDMDLVFSGVNNNDFSKIQGRFPTRVKMSTSDVKEVIEKRVLLKKSEYLEELKAYYEGERESIHNKLNFDNGMHIALYKNKEEYAKTYPFVSYQYGMLQTMLTQLRDKSRAGKNISNAARSMLKTFKDTVVAYKDEDSKTVIPMYAFHDSLTTELDTPTLNVFSNARKNPDLEVDFDVNVLKTLFLVKYYDGLSTSITNVTAMMVSSFDQNRIDLKKQVEEALGRLVQQNFVQRNGDSYIFLTNDEQEINRQIKRETIDREKRVQMMSRIAFGEILDLGGKFKYDSTHQYPFNRMIDMDNVEGMSYELTFKISTPSRKVDAATLSLESIDAVLFELPPDDRLTQAFDEYIATESYLRKNSGTEMTNSMKIILDAKESELKDLRSHAVGLFKDALQSAAIYINQSQSDISEVDPKVRADKAMRELIEARYHKMSYIRNAKKREMIEQMFKNKILVPFDEDISSDNLAVNEVIQYLNEQSSIHATVRISNVMDKFRKIPYGFGDDDIAWILGLLFRHNKINLVFEGTSYDGKKIDAARAMELLTKQKNYDKIEVKLRDSVSLESIARAVSLFGSIFSKSLQSDESALVNSINNGSSELYSELGGYLEIIRERPEYPWKGEIDDLRIIIANTKEMGSPSVFKYIDNNEQLLKEVRSKMDKYRDFYVIDSSRRRLFDKGIECIRSFKVDENCLSGKIVNTAGRIKEILTSSDLKDLPELNGLCSEFNEELQSIIEENKPGHIEDLDAMFEQYQSDFVEHSELMIEFEGMRNEAEEKIKGASNIGDLPTIVRGFDIKARGLLNRVPRPESTLEQSPEKPAPELIRGNVSVRRLISTIKIDSELDIDSLLASMKEKMIEKLKEGPFDIRM